MFCKIYLNLKKNKRFYSLSTTNILFEFGSHGLPENIMGIFILHPRIRKMDCVGIGHKGQ